MTKRILSLFLAVLTVVSLCAPAFGLEEPGDIAAEEFVEVEEIPEMEELPEVEDIPDVQEAPEGEEAPETEDVPVIEEAPAAEEVPLTEEPPAVQEAPEAEDIPREVSEEAEEVPGAEDAPETDTDEEVVSFELSQVNPLYEDVITEADLTRSGVDEPAAAAATTVTIDATNVESAGLKLRELMKSRSTAAIAMTFKMSSQPTASTAKAYVEKVLAVAYRHTGVPTEGDYLRWQYAGYDGQFTGSSTGSTWKITFVFNISYFTTAAQEKTVTSRVSSLVSQLKLTSTSKSDYDKIKAIYDYICANVKYDYTHSDQGTSCPKYLQHSAYAALINNNAVCQGYATLLYRLMLEAGIDCRVIDGKANGGNHAWNIVKLNGLYYNVDATWDCELYNYGYQYFLKSNADFANHTSSAEYKTSSFNASYPMTSHSYKAGTKHGLIKENGKTYYYVNGVKQTGLKTIGGKTYYFSVKDGHMLTGLVSTGNGIKRYFSVKDGRMLTGRVNTGNGVYRYFSVKDGRMLKGRVNAGGGTYYYCSVNDGHIMKGGRVNAGGGTYYYCSAKDGHILRGGWIKVNGVRRYYADKNGVLYTGLKTIGGKQYYFSVKDGLLMKGGWIKINGVKRYYANKNGVITKKA